MVDYVVIQKVTAHLINPINHSPIHSNNKCLFTDTKCINLHIKENHNE